MKTRYFDPKGNEITKKRWMEFKQDDYVLRRFENENISVTLYSTSFIANADDIPRSHWKLLHINTWNILRVDHDFQPLADPKYVEDPDGSKAFRTLGEAETFFDQFTAKYTDCYFDGETGKLIEVDNKFAPPDPDVPVFVENSPIADSFGSW